MRLEWATGDFPPLSFEITSPRVRPDGLTVVSDGTETGNGLIRWFA